MDFLNNRELAIALWLIVIAIYTIFSSKMGEVRSSFRSLISAFCARQIIFVLILMVTYMGVIIYLMEEIGLWNAGQIKNTIFWAVSVALMSLFKMESIKKDKNFFKHAVFDNLRLLAIIQFIVGVYAFPLWVELLIVPISIFVGGMSAVAEKNERYNQVKRFLDSLLMFFGSTVILYTAYMLMTNFEEIYKENTVYDFIVPSLLTVFYLPFLFFLMVYTAYELAFIRLNFFVKERKCRNIAKIYAVVYFNFHLSQLERWISHILRERITSHKELINSFKHVRKVARLEKEVRAVPIEEGWSPYIAKDFLSNESIVTGYYNKAYGDEWWASSPMVTLGSEIMPDNITYYLEGVEGCAKTLKLILNINDSSRALSSKKKLMHLAGILIRKSLNMSMTESTIHALLSGEPHRERYGSKMISVVIDRWPGHSLNGYDIKFVVSDE